MEKIVLIIGGLLKSFEWSDLFFFAVILLMLLLLVYVVYLVKIDETEFSEEVKNLEMIDKIEEAPKKEEKTLLNIVNDLETNYKPEPIDLSSYEREQEDTAIISYQELLSRTSNNIYYEDEYDSGFDDVKIQKVDNKEMSNTQELVDLPKAVMMRYESEEDFLSALKVLQKNLVR